MTLPFVRERSQSARGGLQNAGRPGAVWALPAVLFFAFFALLPLGYAVYLSFTQYKGIVISPPKFVAFENWAELFADPQVLQSLIISVILVALAVVTQTPVALLIGVWTAGPQRGRAIVAALYFIPLLMSSAAIAVLFSSLLDPNFGLPDAMPWLFGDGNLLGSPTSATAVITFVLVWQFVPFHSLIYQGAARAIPPVLYQAAALDGAGIVRQFFSITLPQLTNTLVTSVILIIVGTFTTFETILIITAGGPSGSTTILAYLMYITGFGAASDYGYASAIAVVLIVIASAISLVMVKLTGFDRMRSSQEGV
ncbi:xylobiose transport system permease protein [Microbacterium endophyticum]|uniref:Xylobiose transport system permease protein n=1 Tax=Microbacterium endophyticum TaxID=1526412 RepID=A0A7W4YPM6_9MICO|nr:sugar ABC transporter permease [Microbacterium endophyticum]MBB2976931.1 xylobiose transport system permease protein [Microbacterium endophyticum]NIK35751.1 xylobiose transport system permease protein [Microbacterium endophyticum]